MDADPNALRKALFLAFRRCEPSQLGEVLLLLGLDTDPNIPPAPAVVSERAQGTVRIVEQRPGGLEALRHALFEVARGLLPDGERELAELRARLRDFLGREYGKPSARKGLADTLDLDVPLAKASLDGLLLQLSDRAAMHALVRVVLQEIEDSDEQESAAHAEMRALLDELREGTDDEDACLRVWLEWTRDNSHALLEFHPWVRARELNDVFVEVNVAGHAAELLDGHAGRMQSGAPGKLGPRSLESVLEHESGRFWTLVGHPGTGKTTLLRRVAIASAERALAATRRGDTVTRIPVFVALAQWERSRKKLLTYVSDVAARACDRMPRGAAEFLRQALHDGRALLLLDGLDEVDPARVDELTRAIAGLVTEWPKCQIVMSSRLHGYKRPSARFGELDLVPLNADQQLELARSWLEVPAAEALCARVQADVSLRALAEVPLLMTRMCLVERERLAGTLEKDESAPRAPRPRLYFEVTRLLLRGKPVTDGKARSIEYPGLAREVLEDAALSLLHTGGLEWDADALERCLLATARWSDVHDRFGGFRSFAVAIEDVTAILFAADTMKSRYRFLHRSLQEYLAACALRRRGQAAWSALAGRVEDVEGRWSEVFSLLAGMLPRNEAVELLRDLTERNEALGQRALATCDGLEDSDVVELLRLGRLEISWTGYAQGELHTIEERHRFYTDLIERICDPTRTVQLLSRLLPFASVLDLALVYRTLQKINNSEAAVLLQRERFFDIAGRPLKDVGATWVPARELTYRMGSPDIEEGRDKNEGPQHEVTLEPYEIMTTPVTWGMYLRFAKEHWPRPKHASDAHPVTYVSWYEAWIFAIWLGGRLPTEAEWECACRAGSQTRFCFGDDEAQLGEYAWFDGNAEGSTHPVGTKKPNAWGLYDVHGNIFEWCIDNWRDYATSALTKSGGPNKNREGRPVRGGFYGFDTQDIRSASRFAYGIDFREDALGFRCVRRPRRQ